MSSRLAATTLLLLFTPAVAGADPCANLPNPIYGLGGSATKPTIAKLSQALNSLPEPYKATIVYQSPGACLGIYALLNNTTITGTGKFWDATGVEQSCELPSGGQVVDFASMANSHHLCPLAPATLPSDIGDYQGTVNTINLIVPLASSQRSISAEAAYFVFGFGAQGQAAPWTVESEIAIRDSNAAVQQLLGEAIRVPASKFTFGTNSLDQNGSIARVANSSQPEAAIGFVSGQAAETARSTVRTLAYQHYGQTCGYLPDSTSTALDKKNVRDGRYFIWTPQHWYAKKNPKTGVITSPAARTFLGYLNGDIELPPDFDLLKLQIEAGAVPKCAMKVWREGDLGKLSKYTPLKSCAGYFESLTGGTTATACPNGPSDCSASAPACNYGYCEVQ